ncbi:MAG TPA: DctP family TRAP transporter solute-binding subunit [Spirochaetia bacterium]|nr:DctP family TRAP transporter solute-binding subunit [Spirochaetia bacterium]
MKKIFATIIIMAFAAAAAMAGGKAEAPTPPPSTTGAAQPGAIILKLAHADSTDPYTSRKQDQALAFANLVNARSNGRIHVEIYGAGALGGEKEYVASIKQGSIQAGIASGVVSNFFKPAMVTSIPYVFPSADIAWTVLDGPFGQKLSDAFLKETGMRNLAFSEVGFRNFTNSVREIKSPADMKGLKIRVQEDPIYTNMVKGLGASPTPIAWPETYTSLQTHVVDGEENPVSTILFAKFAEVQKYLTLDKHVYGVDWFIINEKFYESLPPDLRYIVSDSARISATVGRGVQQLLSAVGISQLQSQGMQVYVPSAAEIDQFKNATQPPVLDWLKTQIDPSWISGEMDAVQAAYAESQKIAQ